MKCCIVLLLFTVLAVGNAVEDRFFISAPNVFHIGVKEKVFIQVGPAHFNQPITLYLEHVSGTVVSEKKTVECKNEGNPQTVELMIKRDDWLQIQKKKRRPYLNLQVESPSFKGDEKRRSTKVLVSNHRGYIFIQTDQPMYNPTQKVNYRIFTLDHRFRPHEEPIYISIFNAYGNRVLKTFKVAMGGIYRNIFSIPDVSKMGTWKITAHYEDDEQDAAVREFKVQKSVLPSFEVNIAMQQNYILLNDIHLNFTISAMYSYGKSVKGAYHCQFGVVKKGTADGKRGMPTFIKGLEKAGSVQNGIARVSFQLEDINLKLKERLNNTLFDLQKNGLRLFLGVFVTNVQSGEMQEAEVYLPIISQKYTLDLSRTRSHFIPGYPLDVVLVMRLPDGSPAADVPVNINVKGSQDSWQGNTNQEGIVSYTFNIADVPQITVDVSAGGLQKEKIIKPASSPSGSYLHIAVTNKVYSVNEMLSVTFSTKNGPSTGSIYYMVLSRGIIVKEGSLNGGTSAKHSLQITADMVPFFRLIGYYYTDNGNIIADSVWVDVRDECPIQVKVQQTRRSEPGKMSELEIDLHGHAAKVALLAVDKAFYGLSADNKLTAKQVFSTMSSYDLGCSYGGGSNQPSVLVDAGLSFVDQSRSHWRQAFQCLSTSARKRRSVDLQKEMMTLKSNYTDTELQECCSHAFSPIPMRRKCKERASRVLLLKNKKCADAFLKCCHEAEKLRKKKMLEEGQTGFGRTASIDDIKQFFLDPTEQYIRRFFPPSFDFTEFDVNGKIRHVLTLPDSITTWEIQVATFSAESGFCVVRPYEVKAFKESFVSLTLPYSVKKFEQLSISPVIYNYGDRKLELAVHLEQTEGLCSPASATTSSYVQITMEPQSSQFVSFSAVPMVDSPIPIKIRLYDIEDERGIDAVEKNLNVQTEGLEKRVEKTQVVKLDGKSTKTLSIDGSLPDNTVPDASSNIFISVEADGFGSSYAKNLLSPEKVASLIVLPSGCLEQTMRGLAPTALAIRYLDLSDQWFDLPAGARDRALDNMETGSVRIHDKYRIKNNGGYASWQSVSASNWLTALVVKVLSLIAERLAAATGQQGRTAKHVPVEPIQKPVDYLISVQMNDGSYPDPHPVLHRGVMKSKDRDASMTAFITLALNRSLLFLTSDRPKAEAAILKATTYLESQFAELEHPYAVATAAYCLSVCLPQEANRSFAWRKLQSMAIKENGCYMWTNNPSDQAKATAVETTAYALLTAVAHDDRKWADEIACWLTSQENYFGGYRSSQDTLMALEALSEYELKRYSSPAANMIAEFTAAGKNEIIKLALENKNQKVEADLKIFTGNKVNVSITGKGEFKFKTVKAYHLLDPEDDCTKLSLKVSLDGQVTYTAGVVENYNYYEDYDYIEGSHSNQISENTVTYSVCVSVSPNLGLTGMSIIDITLLSGFKAIDKDLERLKLPPEQYITHYEISYGRVLIYLDKFFANEECFSFKAEQTIPVGLLQPAPAVFYDYYEPQRKCTVFYSAPKRSKMVSKLCSEDVCQCAERPCHQVQETFKGKKIKKDQRLQYACFFPIVEYAYIVTVNNVSVKSNFELYKTTVNDVLRTNGDMLVKENSVRVFAKRLHCKGELELGKQYLIMGKDGSTTDSNGAMQYLLESNTWVERKPLPQECQNSANKAFCYGFNKFVEEYKMNGCTQ
ncbi:complement C4-B isoform X2 [Melanotaenia boesemani]|uniref:complement C4-B isoform X2 n=1 Tax=Melanotaenia boesemani TaxID=1250792 RepID=UPI001C048CBA|nr:complement C4-B isoform X2 [Melanotaenia boesemani]